MSDLTKRVLSAIKQIDKDVPEAVYMCIIVNGNCYEGFDSRQVEQISEVVTETAERFKEKAVNAKRQKSAKHN
jgi:hypothetical protein